MDCRGPKYVGAATQNNKQFFEFVRVKYFGLNTVWSVHCRSQWPRGLRRRSAAARLLRLWIRISPGDMDVYLL